MGEFSGQAWFGKEATLIAVLAGLDACGPAWSELVTNAGSNELALLGGSSYSYIKSRAILNF